MPPVIGKEKPYLNTFFAGWSRW